MGVVKTRHWRRWLVATVLLLAAGGAATVAMASEKHGHGGPWTRDPTFEVDGGPGSILVTEATGGDPVVTSRWALDAEGDLTVLRGPTAVVGQDGEIEITDLEPGLWIVATEQTVHWAVAVG